ncbi:MAG: rhodanese-like domain-containing protein [Bacteroidota bacterium]|nr:rhodanese-like domain-containing protein [Bacteroidota bacterium]
MNEITVEKLRDKLAAGESILLVDVREPYENEEFNIGGLLIPLADLSNHVNELRESGAKEIVLYCRSGNRSAMAQKLLALNFDIKNTSNLRGGMNSWRDMK